MGGHNTKPVCMVIFLMCMVAGKGLVFSSPGSMLCNTNRTGSGNPTIEIVHRAPRATPGNFGHTELGLPPALGSPRVSYTKLISLDTIPGILLPIQTYWSQDSLSFGHIRMHNSKTPKTVGFARKNRQKYQFFLILLKKDRFFRCTFCGLVWPVSGPWVL
jgi:hypothetical protein